MRPAIVFCALTLLAACEAGVGGGSATLSTPPPITLSTLGPMLLACCAVGVLHCLRCWRTALLTYGALLVYAGGPCMCAAGVCDWRVPPTPHRRAMP